MFRLRRKREKEQMQKDIEYVEARQWELQKRLNTVRAMRRADTAAARQARREAT